MPLYALEERLTRNKRDSSFPVNAIKLVLELGNLKYEDLDYIAYSRNERANFSKKLQYGIRNFNSSLIAFREQRRRAKKKLKAKIKLATY